MYMASLWMKELKGHGWTRPNQTRIDQDGNPQGISCSKVLSMMLHVSGWWCMSICFLARRSIQLHNQFAWVSLRFASTEWFVFYPQTKTHVLFRIQSISEASGLHPSRYKQVLSWMVWGIDIIRVWPSRNSTVWLLLWVSQVKTCHVSIYLLLMSTGEKEIWLIQKKLHIIFMSITELSLVKVNRWWLWWIDSCPHTIHVHHRAFTC